MNSIEKGDRVVLWKGDEAVLLFADGETKKVSRIGVIDTDRFVGKRWGSKINLGRKSYRLLQPSLADAPEILERDAQVILPRIGAQIALYCDIHCGKRVIEGGAGSGMFSALLSKKIGREGELVTYEVREDHLRTAEKNLERLDLPSNWCLKNGDVTKDVKERDVDAFVVDIPEPWKALKMAEKALKDGAYFAAYVPSTDQLGETVRSMRDHGFFRIKSFECLERDMVVGERGVRPSFEMLGHAGYVVVGRKAPKG